MRKNLEFTVGDHVFRRVALVEGSLGLRDMGILGSLNLFKSQNDLALLHIAQPVLHSFLVFTMSFMYLCFINTIVIQLILSPMSLQHYNLTCHMSNIQFVSFTNKKWYCNVERFLLSKYSGNIILFKKQPRRLKMLQEICTEDYLARILKFEDKFYLRGKNVTTTFM